MSIAVFLISVKTEAQQLTKVIHGHLPPGVANRQARPIAAMSYDQAMKLSLVLPLRNQAELRSLFQRLYDPTSPDFRHFLTVEQFSERFGPTEEDYSKVAQFARNQGFAVGDKPRNRMIVPISGDVAKVEKAFNVSMKVYQHPTENRTFFSPDREPSIAQDVPIAHLSGLNDYSKPRPMLTKSDAIQAISQATVQGTGPGGSYLASDMRAAYYGGTALTGAGQSVGLVEFDGYNLSDVNLTFSSAGQSYTVPIENVLLDGQTGSPNSNGNAEVVLDIVQAIGMAPGLTQVRVYIGSSDVDILNAVASENIANEVSISWGWTPDDPATDDPFFMEMIAQGQSVFVASGDSGAYAPVQGMFFPAEDEYVTAVGGTHLSTAGAGGAWTGEFAWNGSGGGISPDGFSIPAWQAGVANTNNLASSISRNIPDVAMEGDTDNYSCSIGECNGNWGGTSFAAPRWAAFTALMNQKALANGNQPLGFLNPSIYAIGNSSDFPSYFHDITAGNNQGVLIGYGYEAVAGYDLVTGWGSPNGENLIAQMAQGAVPQFTIAPASNSLTILPGGSVNDMVRVTTEGNFNGSINLSISGLPTGLTGAWSVNPVSTAGSVLTLTADSHVMGGSYLLTVTGSSGALSATTTLAIEINGPSFYITPTTYNLDLMPGGSTATAIEVVKNNGFDGDVSLAVTSPLPEGVTSSWVIDSDTGEDLLVFTATGAGSLPSPGQPLQTMVTLTGTSGDISSTATVALDEFASGIMVIPSPLPLIVVSGQSVTSTVYALPWGTIAGEFMLSAPELPAGVTATFNPVTVQAGQSSTMTLTADASAPAGTSIINVQATNANGVGGSTVFAQVVESTPAPMFNLTTSNASVQLNQSATASVMVTETDLNGFSGNVTLSTRLPPGIHAAFSPVSGTETTTLTLTADDDAVPGTFLIAVCGDAGTVADKAFMQLVVSPLPAFTLSTSLSKVTLMQGGTATANIVVTPQADFSGNVTLTAYGLPAGVTASFNANPTSSASELTLVASPIAIPGMYNLTVSGKSADIESTLVLQLQIVSPIVTTTTLTSSASTAVYGSSITLAATVSASSATPAGSVSFYSGADLLGAGTLNGSGVATLSTIDLPIGSDSLTAVYSGNSTYATSTSRAVQVTVSPASNPKPNVSGFFPALTNAGGAAFALTINGSNFIPGSVVYWGSTELATNYDSSSQLTAQVPASLIAVTGAYTVLVQTPAPGGGASNSLQFEVDSAVDGLPTAPTLSSTSVAVQAGSAASIAVTLPSDASSVSVSCLNLPTGASCGYSSSTNTVTIWTGSTTPTGMYQVTVVFSETITGTSFGLLPLLLLLPVNKARKRLVKGTMWLQLLLGVALLGVGITGTGCSGNSSGSASTATASTRQVTSSGVVNLTIR